MLESCDLNKLGKIYTESIGLGPEGESTTGLGAPIQTRIQIEDEENQQDLKGRIVLWRNAAWLVASQQGVNVKLIKLSDEEAVAPAKDVKLTPKQLIPTKEL